MHQMRKLCDDGQFDDDEASEYVPLTNGTTSNAWDIKARMRNFSSPNPNNFTSLMKNSGDVGNCPNCRRQYCGESSNICTYCLMRKENPFIKDYLHKRLMCKYTHNILQWSAVWGVVFVILLLDIFIRIPSQSWAWIHRAEIMICKCTFVAIFVCLGLYYCTQRYFRINDIGNEQKQLLGIFDGDDNKVDKNYGESEDMSGDIIDDTNVSDSDDLLNFENYHADNRGFGFVSELKFHFTRSANNRACVCLICKALSSDRLALSKHKSQTIPHANTISSFLNCTPPQYYRTPTNCSQIWKNKSSYNLNQSDLSKNSSYKSEYASFREGFIENERDLNDYLDKNSSKYEDFDIHNNMYDNNMTGSVWNPFFSFWRNFNKPINNFDVPAYQFSPPPVLTPVNTLSEQISQDMFVNQSVLVKGISPECLVLYVAKVRRWLSSTILERLSAEITASNKIFRNCGLPDVEIGVVGLERLRKIVEVREFVNRYMPNLPTIYRFLNFCPNQSYYVQRIKELANGSCLADYNWNNITNPTLPSDAAILFHIFCVYIDSQLMPMPQGGSERPFYSQYVILDDKKSSVSDLMKLVRNRAQCAIIWNDLLRPKFSFICNNEIQSCISDCNNLFYVIIQFLIYMRNHKDGMLEGVSLGIQGINILSVIE